jgi:hypothetical protein
MTTPLVSIIVPTVGRPASMQRLLRSLSVRQGAASFEVVLVVDGVAPAAAGVGDPRGWPFAVRVVESAARGAAAARNTGARAAASQILVFLDDDLEVDEGTVSAHATYHAGGPDRIGAGGLTPVPVATGFLGAVLAGWWDVVDERLNDPRHRFTFRDLLTGHCSMRRHTFDRVGGFDESLQCHEDYDFGYRALQLGLSIRRVPGAHARHHDGSNLAKVLKRKRDEGQAGVQLAARHPLLRRALPLGQPLQAGRVALLVHRAAVTPGFVADLVPVVCGGGMRIFEGLRMRGKWRVTLERAMDYWYWRGVRERAGSRAAVEALRPGGASDDSDLPLEIDLAHGLAYAESCLDRERPASVRIRLGSSLIGTVPADPGAEPLRGVHLRALLLKFMLRRYVRAAAAAGLMPDMLASGLRAADPADTRPEGRATESAA